jgi:hypothetical protein
MLPMNVKMFRGIMLILLFTNNNRNVTIKTMTEKDFD